MGLVPDEAQVLPSPRFFNRNSVQLGLMGYIGALLHNGYNQYLVLQEGVHRQVLFTTIGVLLGYHLTKNEDYRVAKKDRELFSYMKRHIELFALTEPKRVGEITEPFHPVRQYSSFDALVRTAYIRCYILVAVILYSIEFLSVK